MTTPTKNTEYVFVRMNPEIYKKLESELLSRCAVTPNTTAIEAGRIIGINEALRYLRDGYTVPKG